MALALLATVHANVNCSDLDRSLAFYRDALGLAPVSHTRPLPQDGRGFGLEGAVQWDAHLLHDARGAAGPAVDLLEWQRPRPVGRPAKRASQLGIDHLCVGHPDLDALHARLVGAGVRALSEPLEMRRSSGRRGRAFRALDPDGARIEFSERPGGARLLQVSVNCRDLDRSADWYQRVLDLAPAAPRTVLAFEDGRGLGAPGLCRLRAERLGIPGNADLGLELVEWIEPAPVGEPARAANQLGWFRIAWLVEDAAASCAELDRLGVAHSGPCWLDMGPEIPIAGLHAVFFRDPDGACLELIERPQLPA